MKQIFAVALALAAASAFAQEQSFDQAVEAAAKKQLFDEAVARKVAELKTVIKIEDGAPVDSVVKFKAQIEKILFNPESAKYLEIDVFLAKTMWTHKQVWRACAVVQAENRVGGHLLTLFTTTFNSSGEVPAVKSIRAHTAAAIEKSKKHDCEHNGHDASLR